MQQEATTPAEQREEPPRDERLNVFAVVGFLLALAGLSCGVMFSDIAFLGTLGLAVSIFALFRPGVGRGLAIAGVALGLAATVFGLIMLFLVARPPATPPVETTPAVYVQATSHGSANATGSHR